MRYFTVVVLLGGLALFAVPPLYAQSPDTPPATPGDTAPPPSQRGDSATEFKFGYSAYHEQGALNSALTRLKAAYEADTDFSRARYWLGKVYYALGYNDSAVRTWKPGTLLTGEKQAWFTRALAVHDLSYNSPGLADLKDWNYATGIDGKTLGEQRNINPSALGKHPRGGFYSASYQSNKVLYYSEEGQLLDQWSGFKKPIALSYLRGRGLLVAEFGANRIRLITDTGLVQTFASQGVDAPYELFTYSDEVYVFNDGPDEIVRLTVNGDTRGRVWQAPTLVRIEDVALDSRGRFWLLDQDENRLLVVDRSGKRQREIKLDPNLGLRRIWWRRGHLFAAAERGFMRYHPDSGAQLLRDRGNVISGKDVSGCLISGDRLILARFENSTILVYRTANKPEPDILVQSRRAQFEDYPVIRMNLLLRDSLGGSRFRHLDDKNFGVSVEGYEALPSYLRPTRNYYDPGWIMLVDNSFSSRELWEEIRPFLQKVINRAPEDTLGTIWRVYAENNSTTVAPLTGSKVKLRNSLNSFHPYPEGRDFPLSRLVDQLHNALDGAFRRRGPTGVLVVSPRIDADGPEFSRLGRRLRNNGVPLVIVNPSLAELPGDHSLKNPGRAVYMNFRDLSTERVWSHYNRLLSNHYTALYRSPLNDLESGAWRKFEYEFHYYGGLQYRFPEGYQLP